MIRDIVIARKIKNLYHFTRIENLRSIYMYGLMSRSELECMRMDFVYNDIYRLDQCEKAISLSIEFPNYKLFYGLRMNDPNTEWAVIEISASVLYEFDCAFCWTNAANSNIRNISIEQRMNEEAFLQMFEERQGGFPSRMQMGLGECYPTDPQAEVLVFGKIPIEYFNHIFFYDAVSMIKYQGEMSGISSVNKNAFDARCDWEYWKI